MSALFWCPHNKAWMQLFSIPSTHTDGSYFGDNRSRFVNNFVNKQQSCIIRTQLVQNYLLCAPDKRNLNGQSYITHITHCFFVTYKYGMVSAYCFSVFYAEI